jgi:mannose-6-phosphate isomerase-like protein (cupin superfamily)
MRTGQHGAECQRLLPRACATAPVSAASGIVEHELCSYGYRPLRLSSRRSPIENQTAGAQNNQRQNNQREVSMKRAILGIAAAVCLVPLVQAQTNDPKPTCNMCPGTYLSVDEIQAYVKKAIAEKRVDQQARDVDIGKAHIGIGVVHRGKLDAAAANSVAEHDLVSEVYYIVDGSGTLKLGPDILDMKRRPATTETVRLFNGPGNNGSEIRNGASYNLKTGDVVVIPAGTGHQFTKIDDHITYIMVRIDPDKVTPLKDETASQVYLRTPRPATGTPREE